jgi:hypothetical protein
MEREKICEISPFSGKSILAGIFRMLWKYENSRRCPSAGRSAGWLYYSEEGGVAG